MTNHKYIGGASQHGSNWITLFTGTSKIKHFYCSGSRSKHDKQWSVSCECTKPLVLSNQTQWSQKTEQSPAWEGNNLWKGEGGIWAREGERKGTPARTPLFSPFFTIRLWAWPSIFIASISAWKENRKKQLKNRMKGKACQQMRFTDWFWDVSSPNGLSVLLARWKKSKSCCLCACYLLTDPRYQRQK